MWKEPKYADLDAPEDLLELIHDSVYYNSEGSLSGSTRRYQIQMVSVALTSFILASFVISYYMFSFLPINSGINFIQLTIMVLLFLTFSYVFYRWGWASYEEAWYHFNKDDEIFTVIRKPEDQWESIEVPYEEITDVEWTGGNNGKAVIRAAGFSFSTNRATEKRFSSVTELWPQLARIDTRMSNWPIYLVCPSCERRFGHHIGTAQCPWDDLLLIDPGVKGRIDPQSQHTQDLDRI